MIQWYPGHMAKAKKEMEDKHKLVDIVYELLDARVPLSSQNPMLSSLLENKSKLMLLMKSDLADPFQTSLWKTHFLQEGCQVLEVNAMARVNVDLIIKTSLQILEEKIEKERSRGRKERAVRAMIVGIPNVGKSTLINRLVKRKATKVKNTPGVTRTQQWVRISGKLELLDTPGVLWPKFEDQQIGMNLALTGAIRDEILDSNTLGEYFLEFLRKYYPKNFSERYQLDLKVDNLGLINKIAEDKGFLQSDFLERVYNQLLFDFRNGRLGRITLDRYNQEE
ncbi:MAG: ribosome biogenesis GTPase YlqF [Bacilli bacterium]|nr:ribosome biogenesis GTPase YlqF [Bacilli bacterium]